MMNTDDQALLDSLEDRGLFRQVSDSFGGPMGGWAKLVFAVTFLLAPVAIYAIWQFFHAEDMRSLVIWATAVIVLFVGVGFLKEWFFSRMNLLMVLREIRRLQLQVARLEAARND